MKPLLLLLAALAVGCEARVRVESAHEPARIDQSEAFFSHGVLAGVAVYRLMAMSETPAVTNVAELQRNAWIAATNGYEAWASNYVVDWLKTKTPKGGAK
jgi:hypothetical protein